MGAPRFKIFIEGVQVPVSLINRLQVEGEPTRLTLNLWATNLGSKIRRGSYVVVFRWEDDGAVLQRADSKFKDFNVDGVWELFFDGYVEQPPSVSRRETRSLVLFCVQWLSKMNNVYIRATSLSTEDIGSLRDKVFMGIGLEPNSYFDLGGGSDPVTSALTRIKTRIASSETGGVAQGLIDLVKEAANYDDIYARICGVTRFYDRFWYAENKRMTEFIKNQNLVDVISGQVDRMPSKTTLMQIINQLMYQSLYTMLVCPSPKYVENELYQVIYKPQVFFAVPIRCNVIFPHSVTLIDPIKAGTNTPTRLAVIGYNRLLGTEYVKLYATKTYYPSPIGENLTVDMTADKQYAIEFKKRCTLVVGIIKNINSNGNYFTRFFNMRVLFKISYEFNF